MDIHSFGVLAYKDSPYLAACLDSLRSQTIQSNIYITTSTPSDYIRNIAQKYNVELFVTELGKGVLHDDNFCLRQAKTKYVTLAHQDDIYLPHYAETCIAAAEKFTDTLICFTNYTEIMEGTDRPTTFMLRVKRFILNFFMPFNAHLKSKFWKRRFLSFGNPIATPTIMYNLHTLPNFQFALELADKPNTLDWFTWCDLAGMKGTFVYCKKVLLKRRIHADSLTSSGLGNDSRYQEDVAMFKRFWAPFMAKILAKIYASSYASNKDK